MLLCRMRIMSCAEHRLWIKNDTVCVAIVQSLIMNAKRRITSAVNPASIHVAVSPLRLSYIRIQLHGAPLCLFLKRNCDPIFRHHEYTGEMATARQRQSQSQSQSQSHLAAASLARTAPRQLWMHPTKFIISEVNLSQIRIAFVIDFNSCLHFMAEYGLYYNVNMFCLQDPE